MSPIPIRVPDAALHMHADRRLVFQVVTAFGTASGSNVLDRREGRLLVEFHTPVRNLLGRKKTYRTVEWVTPREPEAVDFELVEGPLTMLQDRFVLEDQSGCTRFVYQSRFAIKGWVAGWLLGILVIRPMLRRMMREHVSDIKERAESRAQHSRAFPQQPCEWELEAKNSGE
jgi:hypothetical protein